MACRRSTTAPSTPPRCSCAPCARRLALGRRPPTRSRALLPRRAPLPGLGARAVARTATAGCEYVDLSGHGLANQGWKDSSTRCSSPTAGSPTRRSRSARCRATPTRPRVRGAALLDAFGDGPAGRLARAGRPPARSGSAGEFWVDTERRPRRRSRSTATSAPVDSVDLQHGPPARHRHPRPRSEARPGRRGAHRARHGLRLRAAHPVARDSPRLLPASYHGGSVWPHDTAIAVRGPGRARVRERGRAAGRRAARGRRGLRLPAARAVRRRPGGRRASGALPADPASCRPQAWAAAAPLACLAAVTGLAWTSPGAHGSPHPVADQHPARPVRPAGHTGR